MGLVSREFQIGNRTDNADQVQKFCIAVTCQGAYISRIHSIYIDFIFPDGK